MEFYRGAISYCRTPVEECLGYMGLKHSVLLLMVAIPRQRLTVEIKTGRRFVIVSSCLGCVANSLVVGNPQISSQPLTPEDIT
ncbi:hypothetical protein APLC1_2044 [Limnospira platensis C1]|nr:hypothetical protein APLC1_2044 [Arthrospira platensis C1]